MATQCWLIIDDAVRPVIIAVLHLHILAVVQHAPELSEDKHNQYNRRKTEEAEIGKNFPDGSVSKQEESGGEENQKDRVFVQTIEQYRGYQANRRSTQPPSECDREVEMGQVICCGRVS